jgi:hypothetical protein
MARILVIQRRCWNSFSGQLEMRSRTVSLANSENVPKTPFLEWAWDGVHNFALGGCLKVFFPNFEDQVFRMYV